jgi:fumarate hydratase class II
MTLILVIALSPAIDYDEATSITHKAFKENVTFREAAISARYISPEEYDNIMNPSKMVGDPDNDLNAIIH